MKLEKQQIIQAVGRLGVLAMFPSNPAAQAEIMALISRMARTTEQLNWLVTTMIDKVGEWKGPVELRAIYCTRYPPLDGIEATSSVPGFTGEDSEAAYALEESKRPELRAGAAIADLARMKRL